MFKKIIIFSVVIIFITLKTVISQGYKELDNNNNNFQDVREILHNQYIGNASIDTLRGIKQFKRWEWFWEQRLFNSENTPNALEIVDIINQYKNQDNKSNQVQTVKWNRYGPFETPQGRLQPQGIGRINDIAIDKSNGGRIIVGTAGGGAWISTNAGQTWKVIETTDQLTTSVSDVEISESNPNVIYIGTGDAIGSLGSAIDYYSVGLLKSTDGGQTFNTSNLNYSLLDKKSITKILIDPKNENVVYVATSIGIHKSTDGGSNWKHVYNGAIIKDMEFKPDDSNILYAATMTRWPENLILRSTNAGNNWETAHTFPFSGRVEMTVAEKEPDNIYAVSCGFDNGFDSFQISTDGGYNWSIQSTVEQGDKNILGREEGEDQGGQGMYDLAIAVYPEAPNVIFVGGINIWVSFDNGKNFEKYTHWNENQKYPIVHADQHQFAFSNDGQNLYVANDGGLYRNTLNAQLWEELNNGMDITQFYRLGISQSAEYDIMAGAQDNGTSRYYSKKWVETNGGDGMECAFNPINKNILYNSYQNGYIVRSTDGGKNFVASNYPSKSNSYSAWIAPLIVNQKTPNEVLIGYNDVWLNKNDGHLEFWKKISNFGFPKERPLTTLAMSPNHDDYIYASNFTTLMKTTNQGLSWEKIAESQHAIKYIAVSPSNPEEIFVTKSGFAETGKVLYYDGSSWQDITGNLPAIPVNTVVIENDAIKSVYIGTDIGVFYSDRLSGNWKKLNGELPNTVVSELEIHKSTNTLFAATYGRGIWTTDLLNCSSKNVEIQIDGELTFCEGDSVVLSSANVYPNYQWNTGDTTKSIVIKKSGKYLLSVSNSEYCSDISEVVEVKVNSTNIIAENGNTFCIDELQKKLTIPDDVYDITWSNGSTDNEITITEPGEYSYIGKSKLGCIAIDTIQIENSKLFEDIYIKTDYNRLSVPDGFSYVWYYSGIEIPNSNNNEITINDLGFYSVKITDNNGCEITISSNIITDIDSNPIKDQINIFPNPSDEYINIELGELKERFVFFELYSSTGDLVTNTLIHNNKSIAIDVKELPSGVYFAKINLENRTYFKKLIIE